MLTSNDVRSPSRFGYPYPELRDWELTPDQLVANVKAEINSKYSPYYPSNNSTFSRRAPTWQACCSADVAASFGSVSPELAKQMNVNNLDRQWYITIKVDRFALGTSFSIDFFLGNVPQDVSSRSTASNLIGSYTQLVPSGAQVMYLSGVPSGQVGGQVTMTHNLAAGLSRGVLRDLTQGP
jgi:hypothetical protein